MTFKDFLKLIYGMDMIDYQNANLFQRKALEVDYIDRYGTPIIWGLEDE
jgi:hypothetical protein